MHHIFKNTISKVQTRAKIFTQELVRDSSKTRLSKSFGQHEAILIIYRDSIVLSVQNNIYRDIYILIILANNSIPLYRFTTIKIINVL